jgi:Tol biopolymer transport system component
MSLLSRSVVVFLVMFNLSGCGGGSSSSTASGSTTQPVEPPPVIDPVPVDPPQAGDRVIYIADGAVDGVDELFLAATDVPGVATRLNADLVAGGNVTDFVVNADYTRVLYRADQDTDDVFELYLVDIASPGSSTRINGLLVNGGDVSAYFMFSPDGTQVVYQADEDVNGVTELFLVNIASPGFAANLSGPLVSGGNVLGAFQFTPDGSRVFYLADEASNGVNELFMVDVSVPGVSTRVNGPLVAGGDVTADFVITPDSMQLAYLADETTDNVVELFVVDLSAPGVSTTLNGPLVNGGDVTSGLVLSPDGSMIAYRADQLLNDVFELFVVDLANPGVTTRINRNPASGGDVLSDAFLFSPASDAVAYVADEDTNNINELYLVELASPAVSIKLNAPLLAAGSLTGAIAFSPDGARLVYTADQDTAAVIELYQVDRSAPGDTVKLNSALTAGGNLSGFQFSNDGDRLVYLADQDVDEDFELYMIDLETPGSSVRINPLLAPGGDVVNYSLIP